MPKVAAPARVYPANTPGEWVSPSRSNPDVLYHLWRGKWNDWLCDCPARKRCAHIDALIDRLGESEPSTTDFDESEWIDPSASWAAPALPEYRNPEREKPETMSNSSWSNPNFTKEAERGTGYEPPALEDDIYFAEIIEVGEPFDQAKFDDPNVMQTRFFVQWAIEGDDVPEDAQLRQYMTLPDAYLNSGYLNEKSNLFILMQNLGYDMTGRFRVNPPEWVGKRARLVVKNKPGKEGELRPRIESVMPLKKAGKAPKQAKALAFEIGGELIFAQSAEIKAHPYLRPAMDENVQAVADEINATLALLLARANA